MFGAIGGPAAMAAGNTQVQTLSGTGLQDATTEANAYGFGEFFGDILGSAKDIGTSWFQWEMQSDILEEQVKLKNLENQLNNQQQEARAQDVTQPQASANMFSGLNMQHLLLGVGALIALVIVLKLVG